MMKRFSLILSFIFILCFFTACDSKTVLSDSSNSSSSEVLSLVSDQGNTDDNENNIDELSGKQEEKAENIIPIADSDVSVTPENDEDKENEITEEDNIEGTDDTSETNEEKTSDKNNDETEFYTSEDVFSPLYITINFNHELVKNAEDHDILDLRTSVPYIQSGSCEGADAINAYFADKAFSFSEYIKSTVSDITDQNVELHTAEMVCSITFNRNGFLSIVLDTYSYSGNNESTVKRDCALFDINTGRQLTFWDVVDNANLDSLFSHIVSGYSPSELSSKFDESMFSLTENGLMLSFSSESFNDEQSGIHQFTIPYDACALKLDLSDEGSTEAEHSVEPAGESDE